MSRERLLKAFPQTLQNDVKTVINIIPPAHFWHSHEIGVRINGEEIYIPCRIYTPEPNTLTSNTLNEIQKIILACLFTRHHNGFVRERYCLQLINAKQEWVPVFILQLVGEYVLEIMETIYQHIDILPKANYLQFARENPDFITLITQQMISYWDCYYRYKFPKFRYYPAFKIMNQLGLWNNTHGKSLLLS